MTSLQESLAECRRITRRSGSSFRFAFGVLPHDQRDAMHALYAYFRLSDDLGDDESRGPVERRLGDLAAWRSQLERALAGEFAHPIHQALHWAVETFAIPHRYLFEVLDGVESDLNGEPINTIDDLQRYCYRVASAVGLACIRVWGLNPGVTWEQAEPLAVEAGYAFQLTNILRDLGEDAAKGRMYLPTEDLARYGVSPTTWTQPEERSKVRELVRFQAERAKAQYERGRALGAMLPPAGRVIHELMCRAYEGLLDRIVRKDYDVLTRRIRLSRWTKMKLLAGAWRAKPKAG